MKIMKNENIGVLFKKRCFGCFLELPEDPSARIRFPMMIVYGLLKGRIKYTGDDKDPEEGKKEDGWNLDQLLWHAYLFWLARVYHSDGLEMPSSRRTTTP